jgi:hypothetical protein
LTFRFRAYEVTFRALESVYFPPDKAGNVLRGALWPQLGPLCGDPARPGGLRTRPGGFADPPRPFVIRAAKLNGKAFAAGESFSVGLNLFDTSPRWVNAIMNSLDAWRTTGLGPGRGRVEVLKTWVSGKDVAIDLSRSSLASRCTVEFVTPTELKGDASGSMSFGTLFSLISGRISSLCSLYGPAPLRMDFRGMNDRARLVNTTDVKLEYREVERTSTRTGQTHGIGGFTGSVQYQGALSEFVPWLEAAQWTGVGRHTVWGNGAIEVSFGQ